MAVTLIILAVAIFFFVTGKIRSDLVALCSLLALILTRILTPKEAFSCFSDPVIVMIAGLFVVSGGIFRTGLARMVSNRIMKFAGEDENRLFILIVLVTAVMSAFVSNTGTVAIMLPIVVSIAMSAKINVSKLLMPLAFASSIGGSLTLIGTPPNIVIQKVLMEKELTSFKFFSYTPVGLVALVVGVGVLWVLSSKLLAKKGGGGESGGEDVKSLSELIDEYELDRRSYAVHIRNGAQISGKSLRELSITSVYNLNVVRIIRRKPAFLHLRGDAVDEILPDGDTVIMQDDTIEVTGSRENVERFSADKELGFLCDMTIPQHFEKVGIAEVLLMPSSRLVGKKVKDSGFRERYNVSVLGINHRGEYKVDGLADEVFRIGDAILVQGRWEDLERMDADHVNVVLVGHPLEEASKVTFDSKAPLAAVILLGMVAVMVAEVVSPTIAVLCAAVLMVFTGCLKNMEEAYTSINWQSVILIAAMLPMSDALQKTGAAALISSLITDYLGNAGPLAVLAGIYLATSILTLFISNTAAAVLFAPIAFQVSQTIGVSPYPFLMAVAVSAGMSFASPFATPANVMVMSAGRYSFVDYVKVGMPLQLAIGIVMIFILPFFFPFGGGR